MSYDIGATPNISERTSLSGSERFVAFDPVSGDPCYVQAKNLVTDITYSGGDTVEYMGDSSVTTNGSSISVVALQSKVSSDTEIDIIEAPVYGTVTTACVVDVYIYTVAITTTVQTSSLELRCTVTIPAGSFNTLANEFQRIILPNQISVSSGNVIVVRFRPTTGVVSARCWNDNNSGIRNCLLYYSSTSSLTPYTSASTPTRYSIGVRTKRATAVSTADLEEAINVLNDKISKKADIPDPDLVSTSKIYVATGRELNIYNDQIGYRGFDIIGQGTTKGNMYERGYRYTGVVGDVGNNFNIVHTAYSESNVSIATKTTQIIPVGKGVGSGTKQILIIGDSVLADAIMQAELSTIINTDGGITPLWLGTRGTTYKHEAHAGWTVGSFLSTSSPFYKTDKLNLKQYMSDNSNFGGTDTIDFVIIQLGINDMYGPGGTQTQADIYINNLKTLITAILDVTYGYPSAKIIVSLPPIGANSQDGDGVAYGANYINLIYMEKAMHLLWKSAITAFDNGVYNASVTLCHSGLWVDRTYGYPKTTVPISARVSETYLRFTNAVHPSDDGKKMISDAIYSHLMGLLS